MALLALKILLANDSMTAQNMGKKILVGAGYDVVAVSNGAAAVKKLAEVEPEIVVLDVYMPGYSGLEISEKIKNSPLTAHIPVLLTVGKLEPFRQEDGIHAKADGVIVKPFEARDLIAVVAQLAERVYAAKEAKEVKTAVADAAPSVVVQAAMLPEVFVAPALAQENQEEPVPPRPQPSSAVDPPINLEFVAEETVTPQAAADLEVRLTPAPPTPPLPAAVPAAVAGLDLSPGARESDGSMAVSAPAIEAGSPEGEPFSAFEIQFEPSANVGLPIEFPLESGSLCAGPESTFPRLSPQGYETPESVLIFDAGELPQPSAGAGVEETSAAFGQAPAEESEFGLFESVFGNQADRQVDAELAITMDACDAASAILEPRFVPVRGVTTTRVDLQPEDVPPPAPAEEPASERAFAAAACAASATLPQAHEARLAPPCVAADETWFNLEIGRTFEAGLDTVADAPQVMLAEELAANPAEEVLTLDPVTPLGQAAAEPAELVVEPAAPTAGADPIVRDDCPETCSASVPAVEFSRSEGGSTEMIAAEEPLLQDLGPVGRPGEHSPETGSAVLQADKPSFGLTGPEASALLAGAEAANDSADRMELMGASTLVPEPATTVGPAFVAAAEPPEVSGEPAGQPAPELQPVSRPVPEGAISSPPSYQEAQAPSTETTAEQIVDCVLQRLRPELVAEVKKLLSQC